MESANGLISAAEFAEGVALFTEISDKLGESWVLHGAGGEEELIYMKKSVVKLLSFVSEGADSPNVASGSACDLECDLDNMQDDDLSISPEAKTSRASESERKEMCTFEYHVVYSTSYQVPVLYLNVHKRSGALLSLDELWRQVPAHYQQRLRQERWTLLTQQEHPLLGRPFFQLHPCYTSRLMACVQAMRRGGAPPSGASGQVTTAADLGANLSKTGQPECLDRQGSGHSERLDRQGSGHPERLGRQGSGHPERLDRQGSGHSERLDRQGSGHPERLDRQGSNHPERLDPQGSGHPERLDRQGSGHPERLDRQGSGNPERLGRQRSGHLERLDRQRRVKTFQYLVSWLSSVGPVVQLEVPVQFAS